MPSTTIFDENQTLVKFVPFAPKNLRCVVKSYRFKSLRSSKLSVHGSLGHIIVHGDIVPKMCTVTIYRNMKSLNAIQKTIR
jgi:hypothetical protein